MPLENLDKVLTLVVPFVTWLIVEPLKTGIEGLQKSVDKLAEVVEKHGSEVSSLKERVAGIEKSLITEHENVGEIRTRLYSLESRRAEDDYREK